MKKVGILLLLLWGTLGISQAEPYSHSDDVAKEHYTFLAHRLLTTDSLRYCITPFPRNSPFLSQQDAEILITAALREWTHGLALRIRQAGREKEFKDIVAILDKPLTLSAVEGCQTFADKRSSVSHRNTQADIIFLISSKQCEEKFKKTTSFYLPATLDQTPLICLRETEPKNPLCPIAPGEYIPQATTARAQQILHSCRDVFNTVATGDYTADTQQFLWEINRFLSYDRPTLFATITHELGHAFGLGDEYLEERPDAYASKQAGEGIMRNLYQPITCDEIDGMITLLDRLNHTSRTFRSFCPGRGLIVDGTEHLS